MGTGSKERVERIHIAITAIVVLLLFGYVLFQNSSDKSARNNDGQNTYACGNEYKIFDSRYFKCADGIYFNNFLLDVDPDTFELLAYEPNESGYWFGYAKDASSIYYDLHLVEEAHLPSFMVIGKVAHLTYAKDKNNVYVHGDVIEGADPESFIVLNRFFAKDSKVVYYDNQILRSADPESFEVYKFEEYARDKKSVYHATDKVEILSFDPTTFEVLGPCIEGDGIIHFYTKDKDGIYAEENLLRDADPRSFKILGYAYSGGEVPLRFAYAADNDSVFSGCGNLVENAHPDTFEFESI